MEDQDAGMNPAAAVADSAEVLSSLASSGALDGLRRRALDALKHNVRGVGVGVPGAHPCCWVA